MTELLPNVFPKIVNDIFRDLENVQGFLSDREVRFLAMAASRPKCEGRILELGTYHGKSTIVLAKAFRDGACGQGYARNQQFPVRDTCPINIVTVDPISHPELKANLRRACVETVVDFRRGFSGDVLSRWSEPIRMLWHDGANLYREVKRDIELARPHLLDGCVVAFHDVLNTSGERIRVYLEEVLGSDHFGPVGICGSIGWGVYRTRSADATEYASERRGLTNRLRRLLPFHDHPNETLPRLQRMQYRMLRWFVPHGETEPKEWLRRAA